MKTMRTTLTLVIFSLIIIAMSQGLYADVVVTDDTATTSRWAYGAADTPIGVLFNFLGDVVAFPFRLLGGLF